MAGNTFGSILRLSTFGESHGVALGGVIDGFPAGFIPDFSFLQQCLDRRKPGQSELVTARSENDQVEFLSGFFEGRTTGAPICFIIRNKDMRSGDYEALKDVFRPSHADYSWYMKFGLRDHRGGGRSSARETAARVAAGALCLNYLNNLGIRVAAWTEQIGPYSMPLQTHPEREEIYSSLTRCPHKETSRLMEQYILEVKAKGDSCGGIIRAEILGCPPGLGAPVFDKLDARLAAAMLSIPACKGFESGAGFALARMLGSEANDAWVNNQGAINTTTNNSGGIQGGISNGQPISFRLVFKPASTIAHPQNTVNLAGENIPLSASGRHDPCVVPRAVSVVESMAALTILDLLLESKTNKID